MLGIKIFARGRISTVWPVPHYAGTAGAILVAQKRNYTKLISCLPRDVYTYLFHELISSSVMIWFQTLKVFFEDFYLHRREKKSQNVVVENEAWIASIA